MFRLQQILLCNINNFFLVVFTFVNTSKFQDRNILCPELPANKCLGKKYINKIVLDETFSNIFSALRCSQLPDVVSRYLVTTSISIFSVEFTLILCIYSILFYFFFFKPNPRSIYFYIFRVWSLKASIHKPSFLEDGRVSHYLSFKSHTFIM